jgi:hypothetical protein
MEGYELESSYIDIINILRKVRGRILLKNIIGNLALGVSSALTLGIVIALTSRFIPIYNVYVKAGYIGIFILLAFIIYSFITMPTLKHTASKVDSFGLKERVSTALELEKEESIYKTLLIEDALFNLKNLNHKEHMPLSPHKKILMTIPLLALVLIATVFIPNPMKDIAQKRHELSQYKKEELKKVTKSEKEIKENKKLTEAQKKAMLAKLQQLKKELKLAKENKEVDKALEKTAKKLELDKKEKLAQDIKKLEEALAQNDKTKELAEALKKNDAERMQKALEELKNMSKSMDAAGKESLKNTLSKAADSVGSNDLKNQLNNLSASLSSGDEGAISKSVSDVSGTLKEGMSEEEMNKALAQLQENLQGQQGQGQQQAQGQGVGQGQGTGQGSGQGQGQGQGNGNGTGSGQGSGQGQGAGGSGAGSGTSNGDGGVTDYGSGGIANKQPGAGKSKEYEKIFTPNRLGGNGETSKLTGKNNGNSGNSESYLSTNPNATLGELKPYDQVAGEYTDKAMENINSYEIPDGMMEMIKDYFSSLQE